MISTLLRPLPPSACVEVRRYARGVEACVYVGASVRALVRVPAGRPDARLVPLALAVAQCS